MSEVVGNSETGFLTRLICFNRLNYTYVNHPERNNNYTRHRYYDYDVLVNTFENRSIMERQIAAYPGKFVLESKCFDLV